MAEIKTQETIDTTPFKRLLVQLGGTPSSFVEGLTWYELLAYLVKYLENEVIPKVNKSIDNYNELIKAFNELKEYVDQYLRDIDDLKERMDSLEEDVYITIDEKCLECKNEVIALINENLQLFDDNLNALSNEIDERFRNWSQELVINNPVTGESSTVQAALNSVYDVTRVNALTALEYDNLELTALAYDEHELTALAYDTLGKNLLA